MKYGFPEREKKDDLIPFGPNPKRITPLEEEKSVAHIYFA
jgi:hypothetical protein